MSHTRFVLTSFICIFSIIFSTICWSQEQNVRPGINDYYQDPNFEQWLAIFESPGREVYDRRMAILEALDLKPGMDVADIGAGTGFYSLLFAQQVTSTGTVYAIDISDEFINNIERRASEIQLDNIVGVVNTAKSTGLSKESIDMAFICDTYHHFEYPITTMQSLYDAMRNGGSVVVIDFRKIKGQSSSWVMGHVRENKQAVIKEIESTGFKFIEEQDLLRTNYFLKFKKL